MGAHLVASLQDLVEMVDVQHCFKSPHAHTPTRKAKS